MNSTLENTDRLIRLYHRGFLLCLVLAFLFLLITAILFYVFDGPALLRLHSARKTGRGRSLGRGGSAGRGEPVGRGRPVGRRKSAGRRSTVRGRKPDGRGQSRPEESQPPEPEIRTTDGPETDILKKPDGPETDILRKPDGPETDILREPDGPLAYFVIEKEILLIHTDVVP